MLSSIYRLPKWLESALEELKTVPRVRRYQKGEIILSQGEAASSLCVILEGLVKLTVVSNCGREAVIGILRSPDIIGEDCMLDDRQRLSSAIAVSSATLLSISKSEMSTASAFPDFSSHLVTYLMSRKARLEEDLVNQIFNSSEERLARTLLNLAEGGSQRGGFVPAPRISQETLASMVGTTRSRISFFMNGFRKRGAIRYGKTIEVNPTVLSEMLGVQEKLPLKIPATQAVAGSNGEYLS
jgi:CRP-like cAMP-binding protein